MQIPDDFFKDRDDLEVLIPFVTQFSNAAVDIINGQHIPPRELSDLERREFLDAQYKIHLGISQGATLHHLVGATVLAAEFFQSACNGYSSARTTLLNAVPQQLKTDKNLFLLEKYTSPKFTGIIRQARDETGYKP